jgi:hypothetical protein
MADPVTIAQTGVDPTTGSYLSSERRKAIFRSTRVSGFTGGGGGGETGRGGAIVVRPQTSLVDKAQDLQIQTAQQSVVGLQEQIQRVRVEVLNINTGLNNLAQQIANDSALEQRENLTKIENERKLNEKKVRIGRERELENRIANALLKPVVAIQQKLEPLFNRIMNALGFMFLGWLTNQGIEALKANAEGNKTKLEEIFRSVTNGVIVAARGFIFVNRVFGSITKIIFSVTRGIVRLTSGLISGLFRGIATLGRMVAGGIKSLFTGGKVAATTTKVASTATKTGIKSTAGKLPLLSLATGAIFGTGRLLQGDTTGALMEYGSGLASTLPGWGTAASFSIDAAIIARDFGAFKGTPLEKNQPKTPKPTPSKSGAYSETPAPSPPPKKPSVQPATPMAPESPTFNFSVDTTNMSAPEPLSPQANITQNQVGENIAQPTNVVQAQISIPQITTPNVGALIEPAPNVIMTSSGGAGNQPQPAQQVEPAGDTPLIQSSNPENFYSLYSQLNYNVVM